MPIINAISIQDAAHILGIGSHDLFRTLRRAGALGQGASNYNLPAPTLRLAGYFTTALVVFQRGPVTVTHEKPMVTATGLEFIRNLLQQHPCASKPAPAAPENYVKNYAAGRETLDQLRAMVN